MNVWTDIAIANLLRKPPPPEPITETLECQVCHEVKVVTEFYRKFDSEGNGKYSRRCKECSRKADVEYRLKRKNS